uniref:Putative secreted peptide n=1 Tax=Anopheles braziliensis TaxID=58242 RepID=A0A2M3ZR25_9DIPT
MSIYCILALQIRYVFLYTACHFYCNFECTACVNPEVNKSSQKKALAAKVLSCDVHNECDDSILRNKKRAREHHFQRQPRKHQLLYPMKVHR